MEYMLSGRKRFSIYAFSMRHRLLISLLLTVTVSIALSPIFVKHDGVYDLFYRIVNFSLSVRCGNSAFILTFLLSLLYSFVLLLTVFLCGISPAGRLFIFPFSAFFGFFCGSYSSVLYSALDSLGVYIFLSLFLLPFSLIFCCLLLADREAFTFSGMLFNAFRPSHDPMSFYSDFKLYTLRFVFIFALLALTAIIASAMSLVFVPHLDIKAFY